MTSTHRWLAAGLFLATLATLVLEILDSRLLSVLTWYHLSFLAVSLAMLGMAAGAVSVFLRSEQLQGPAVLHALPRAAVWLACAIPVSHLLNLCIPIPLLRDMSMMEIVAISLTTIVLSVPFFVSGVVVTLALTRSGGPVGTLYAADLIGAAAGCLLVIPLLNHANITAVALFSAAAAAAAAYCFHGADGRSPSWPTVALTCVLLAAAIANGRTDRGIGVIYPKNRQLWLAQSSFDFSGWNTHSYIIVRRPASEPAFFWGPGKGAAQITSTLAWIAIDGEAGTPITKWDGDPASIAWVKDDVTSLPYHLRRGTAAVIGVGGGRDILSAIWGRNVSITGIEINGILIDALNGRYKDFARLSGRSDVTLVHDEARSYLSRGNYRFDVLQMSLIDTWAATGAGAFTLSENGLYTREAWRIFLNALKPDGVFSVSRWFSPAAVSETTRLLALGVAALVDRGVVTPARNLVMVSRGPVATLLVSPSPFTADDRAAIGELVTRDEFRVLVAPWEASADARLKRIVQSSSSVELADAVRDPILDFSPPTDERPFFFNMLKPSSFRKVSSLARGGVMWGNLRATSTLVLLFAIAGLLVAGIVLGPLVRSGMPAMDTRSFVAAASYFALIGFGYMLIQIPFLQRFSVFLGHPTYTFAVILFSMIFFTGIGSLISERFSLERNGWLLRLPLWIGAAILATTTAIQPAIDATIHLALPARSLIVVAFTAPLSVLLGFCFPIGMRLVGRLSDHATAWMWGINGACGVMASIVAVGISMWVGIDANLLIAAGLYALLVIPAQALALAQRPAARMAV